MSYAIRSDEATTIEHRSAEQCDYAIRLARIVSEKPTSKRVFTTNQLAFIREQGLNYDRVYKLAYRCGSAGEAIIKILEYQQEVAR